MGIKISVREDVPGPRINLKTKTIELPENIKEQNALAALSTLIHEAAHMKYSTVIPDDFAKTNVDHYIVNAMEDVRIDKKNFNLLPNVYDFYLKFIKDHICTKENKELTMKQHMLTRCMVMLILQEEYFHKYCFDKDAMKFIQDNRIDEPFTEGVWHIENQDWVELRKCVDLIKSYFNIKEEEKDQQQQQQGGKGGKGEGVPDDSSPGTAEAPGTGSGDDPESQEDRIKNPEDLVRPASVWEKGSGLRGPGGLSFNPIELTAITRRKFVDALNTTERYTQSDGSRLNTDDLISFFTGELEDLFIDDEIQKVKRSKIVFCLDASGSMGTKLFDNTNRKKTLGKCVKSLIDILDDVRETEGLNVDYDVIAFACYPQKLNKETWQSEYQSHSGGTDLLGAMQMAVDELSDSEIDGNKMVILVTDGEVSKSEIVEVKDLIVKNNSDIKAMLIGIGARNDYCENLCGDNNIICLEHADQIVMESIQEMMDMN
jgi:hypothetical protein